jgi:transposase
MSQGTVEVLIGRERRRRWGLQDKLRIVAETEEPGVTVKTVAARHDVYPSLLHTWRRQVRNGRLGTMAPARFVPVQVSGAVPSGGTPLISATDHPHSAKIEITLPNGSHVRVGNDVSLVALRRVITALRG